MTVVVIYISGVTHLTFFQTIMFVGPIIVSSIQPPVPSESAPSHHSYDDKTLIIPIVSVLCDVIVVTIPLLICDTCVARPSDVMEGSEAQGGMEVYTQIVTPLVTLLLLLLCVG